MINLQVLSISYSQHKPSPRLATDITEMVFIHHFRVLSIPAHTIKYILKPCYKFFLISSVLFWWLWYI